MTNNLKVYSPEWDALEMLKSMEMPDENASLRELREYWLKLREVAKVASYGAQLAAIEYGKAEAREKRKENL